MTTAPERLREAGLRATIPRVAVLGLLAEGGHHTAEAVADATRARLGAVSTQAVYDVLSALVRAGLARTIEPAGSPRLYEARVADNHHHLVCRACGTVVDVDCAVGETPCLTPAEAHGFVLDEAEVLFWGLCPGCRARTDDAHDERPLPEGVR